MQAARRRYSFRTRTAIIGVIALAIWVAGLLLSPLAGTRPGAALFGLPLRAALGLPFALPVFVLTVFWFAMRQNFEDERSSDDG